MGKLNPEEVKVLIKAAQIAREHGITKGARVKEICDKAGISRKTGYKWVNETEPSKEKEDIHLQIDHQKLLKKYKDVCFENEGIRLAMEIHDFVNLFKKKACKQDQKIKAVRFLHDRNQGLRKTSFSLLVP